MQLYQTILLAWYLVGLVTVIVIYINHPTKTGSLGEALTFLFIAVAGPLLTLIVIAMLGYRFWWSTVAVRKMQDNASILFVRYSKDDSGIYVYLNELLLTQVDNKTLINFLPLIREHQNLNYVHVVGETPKETLLDLTEEERETHANF